ncbi:hypothetical protein [Streptacidiphilus sp. P02-A3a]|uniref:hypothetical protein n=1 Tax=Streptacidiphilus sp. P02-A3a TaxID=2704468 RepID=UPI0015FB18FD|nr:DUF2029 domain-containing protein [Streptacidiphilus sp. P02-A3a]
MSLSDPARPPGPSSRRSATWPCVLALTALVAALAGTFTSGGTLGHRGPLYGWYTADTVLFALAVVLLRRAPARRTAALVLLGSLAVALTGLLAPPRTSDDAYRYLWDGQVQAAGISPYADAPTAPALADLRVRTPALFPVTGSCTGWDLHRADGICTHINRPTVHTIYPPVAEFWFLGLHEAGRLTGRTGVGPAQAGGALLVVATTGALLLVLRRTRAPAHRAALWGWCPGVAAWAVNDAHVDTLGALLMVCGLGLVHGRRRGTGGVLLGLATGTKLIPVLALPGAMSGSLARGRRVSARDLLLPGAAGLTFLLSYTPYVIASGLGVLGFLPGYLQEQGYDQGTGFGLLTLLDIPQPLLPATVAAVLLAVVLYTLRYGDPAAPWRGALLVTGTALFLAAPGYPWYALLVVALVAIDGRWEWLAVPVAGEAMYLSAGALQQQAYMAALYLVLIGAAVRGLGRTARTCAPPGARLLPLSVLRPAAAARPLAGTVALRIAPAVGPEHGAQQAQCGGGEQGGGDQQPVSEEGVRVQAGGEVVTGDPAQDQRVPDDQQQQRDEAGDPDVVDPAADRPRVASAPGGEQEL